VKLALTCLHLEHRREPTRLSEIKGIKNALDKANVYDDNYCQIWTGDFNALTKEDYSPEEWAEITNVRQKNSWELPKTELTTQVKAYGFQDTWHLVGCPPPVKTCRFDTRIDYIYANPKLLSIYKVQEVVHVNDPASDHNMVKATFVKRK